MPGSKVHPDYLTAGCLTAEIDSTRQLNPVRPMPLAEPVQAVFLTQSCPS